MMTSSAISLAIIFGIVGLGTLIGLMAGLRREMSLEQWAVGGRRFGVLLMFLLMAGEAYTTFSFLGASGWAYSRGGPTLYILAYTSLAYVISFFILPEIWEIGQMYKLQTQPDFFNLRYGNKYLAAFVSIVGVVCLIPYLQLQITGLGIIVNVASFNRIGRTTAMEVSLVLLAAFVLASGVRAVAWISVLKDVLMVFAALSVGIGIPYIHYRGIGAMFSALVEARPAHLTMPGTTVNLGHRWYISTTLLTSLGFCMWPHGFAATYTAKSSDTLRRNAVVMPLYSITLAFIFFVGFTAVLKAPNLADGDLALLTIVRQSFPAWFLGIVGGAGALTAMVPASILMLASATLFAKNLWRPIFAPAMSDEQVAKLARGTIVVLSALSLYLATHSSTTLVSLLLLGYAGVTQFFPGIVLGLFWKRVTTPGVLTGLLAGVATAAYLILSHQDPFFGWSAGFVALTLNMLLTVAVSVFTTPTETVAEV